MQITENVSTAHWRIERRLQAKFLSFSCSLREIFQLIIGWCTHLEGGGPLLGNPGSATVLLVLKMEGQVQRSGDTFLCW